MEQNETTKPDFVAQDEADFALRILDAELTAHRDVDLAVEAAQEVITWRDSDEEQDAITDWLDAEAKKRLA